MKMSTYYLQAVFPHPVIQLSGFPVKSISGSGRHAVPTPGGDVSTSLTRRIKAISFGTPNSKLGLKSLCCNDTNQASLS